MSDFTNLFNENIQLLNDKDLAALCGMSVQWVRAERLKRRRGDKHALTIDPVMIGKSPRYRATDIMRWIEELES